MAVSEIPKKQKAAIYDEPGSVSTKVVELDVPEPSTGEVLINLYAEHPNCTGDKCSPGSLWTVS